jgi:hypothetical protein
MPVRPLADLEKSRCDRALPIEDLISVLSIGFPFFKRLGGDIDPLELDQSFCWSSI